jgi:molecular chaperone IbpA
VRTLTAAAAFSPDEITITAEQNVLTVESGNAEKGITPRVFKLADYVVVKSAFFYKGLLQIAGGYNLSCFSVTIEGRL